MQSRGGGGRKTRLGLSEERLEGLTPLLGAENLEGRAADRILPATSYQGAGEEGSLGTYIRVVTFTTGRAYQLGSNGKTWRAELYTKTALWGKRGGKTNSIRRPEENWRLRCTLTQREGALHFIADPARETPKKRNALWTTINGRMERSGKNSAGLVPRGESRKDLGGDPPPFPKVGKREQTT